METFFPLGRAFALDHATVKARIFADESLADLSTKLFRT
jgi:hypothetical protein